MKPNIILITVDALRADYAYGQKNTHPFLTSMMEKSVIFSRAISPAPSTTQTFRCLFTNMYPNEDIQTSGSKYNIPGHAEFISNRFRDLGYFTAGFSNNANLTRLQGYDRGFDYFYDGLEKSGDSDEGEIKSETDKTPMKKKFLTFINKHMDVNLKFGKRFFGRLMGLFFYSGYESSRSLFGRIKKFMSKQDKEKPLFLWAHMMEVHSPYNLSMDLFDKIGEKRIPNWERQWLRHVKHHNIHVSESGLSDNDIKKIKRMYKCGIREVDDILKGFFQFLEKNNILDNSIVIITSDHGENLGDWDLLSHRDIYNSVLHVPLIVWNGKERGKIDTVFSNKDLIEFTKCVIDSGKVKTCAGKFDKPTISEARREGRILYSIQDNKIKVIMDECENEAICYSLKDTKEESKIPSDYNDDTIRLKKNLLNHIRSMKNKEKDKIIKAVNLSKI